MMLLLRLNSSPISTTLFMSSTMMRFGSVAFLFVILYWLFLCGGVMIHGVLHAWKMSVFCLCSIVDAVMVVALFCLFFHFHLLTLFMCSAGASET